MHVVFRVDAARDVGTGHVRRCLSLAQALRELGFDAAFVARELDGGIARQMIAARGFDCRSLPADLADPAADAWQTAAAFAAEGADWLVIDHYGLDARWHGAARAAWSGHIRLAAIDDLADRALNVDLVVDHNLATDRRAAYAARVPAKARQLYGPRFALIDPAYAKAPRYAFCKSVRSLGIFMGGADTLGASAHVLEACRFHAAFTGPIEIATTRANPHLAALREACARWEPASLLVDQLDLAAFFARHDLQIGAGGGAIWERCCLGVPTLALVCADNQREVVRELVQRSLVATSQLDSVSIGHALAALVADPSARRRLHEASLGVVDGHGAERVALALMAPHLRLRAGTADDAALAFVWRNHPRVRTVSADPSPLRWDAHREWWANAVVNRHRRLWFGRCGTRDVGVLRVDYTTEFAEVSIYLDPALTGLGLGFHLLGAGLRQLSTDAAAPPVVRARVRPDNEASQALFRMAGFERVGADQWRLRKASIAYRTDSVQ